MSARWRRMDRRCSKLGCSTCHRFDVQGRGPNLTGVFPRAKTHLEFRSGHRPGRLVRRARAHLQGRRGRGAAVLAAGGRGCASAGHGPGAQDLACFRRGDEEVSKQLALVIDLNVCVGCHACVTSCKEWNTSGAAGLAVGRQSLRPRSDRNLLQPRADLRGGRISEHADGAFPQVLPALRGPALRAGVPDRGELQARRGWHRAGRLRQMHRLQVLRLGLSLRRARDRRTPEGDEEVHAVRGSHLRRVAAARGPQARLRHGLPDQRAPVRRRARSGVGGVAGDTRLAAATR